MKNLDQKIMFFVNLMILMYFILLYLDAYMIRLPSIFIGIIREMFVFPLMILQVPLFIVSVVLWISNNFRIKTYSFWAVIILMISMGLTLIPFLI